MPRIRTIKPEFFSDEKMAPLPVLTRFVFLGLISMADDCGRVLDNLKIIDAYIFPETSETSRGSLTDLSAMGRIQRGVTASGQRIIQIVNWTAHQKIEKPNFRSALPPIDPQVFAAPNVEDGPPSLPRQIGEDSGRSRGGVGEESPNHTNDLRPSTDDLRPPTNDHARRAAAGGGNLSLKRESQVGNALALTVAANQAIAARYGEQADPIISSHAGSFAAAKSLDEAGVPLEFATTALAEIVQSLGLEEPPRSLKYFIAPIIRRWEASEAHAQARSGQGTRTPERGAPIRANAPPSPELLDRAQELTHLVLDHSLARCTADKRRDILRDLVPRGWIADVAATEAALACIAPLSSLVRPGCTFDDVLRLAVARLEDGLQEGRPLPPSVRPRPTFELVS